MSSKLMFCTLMYILCPKLHYVTYYTGGRLTNLCGVSTEGLVKLRCCLEAVCGLEWYGYAALGILTAILSFLMDLIVTKLLGGHHTHRFVVYDMNKWRTSVINVSLSFHLKLIGCCIWSWRATVCCSSFAGLFTQHACVQSHHHSPTTFVPLPQVCPTT